MLNKSYLSIYAKSFSWAGFFLPKKTLKKCSTLYDFCRVADNIADDLEELVNKEKKFSKDNPKRSTRHLWINSDLIICHKKLISHDIWDDEEWAEWDILAPIADRMMEERIKEQTLRWSGQTADSMLEAEKLAEKENIEREEYGGVDYWEAED